MNTNVRTSDLSDSIIRALVRQTHRTGFVLTSIYVHIFIYKTDDFHSKQRKYVHIGTDCSFTGTDCCFYFLEFFSTIVATQYPTCHVNINVRTSDSIKHALVRQTHRI